MAEELQQQTEQADPLQQALDMLDESAAIIQELVAQVQSKGQSQDMNKKAESIAAKTGMSYNAVADMLKTAEEKGSNLDAVLEAAETIIKSQRSFGRVFEQEKELSKTGSVAMDKYAEREADLMAELGL